MKRRSLVARRTESVLEPDMYRPSPQSDDQDAILVESVRGSRRTSLGNAEPVMIHLGPTEPETSNVGSEQPTTSFAAVQLSSVNAAADNYEPSSQLRPSAVSADQHQDDASSTLVSPLGFSFPQQEILARDSSENPPLRMHDEQGSALLPADAVHMRDIVIEGIQMQTAASLEVARAPVEADQPDNESGPLELTIRAMQPTDADALSYLQVHYAAVHETAAKHYPPETLHAWAPPISDSRISRVRDAQTDSISLLAEADGRVIGVVTLMRNGELRACYVSPQFSRRGVGKALIRSIELEATRLSLPYLTLDSSTGAEPFYLSQGFHTISRAEHLLSTGLRMPCVKMAKQLGVTQRDAAVFDISADRELAGTELLVKLV